MPSLAKTVGRYELLETVGRGGMAIVYLARQTDLDRKVALKELGGFHGADPSAAQRFLRESRLAGSLSHPNIVTVHEYFVHDGTPYIAMEYLSRGSLRPSAGSLSTAQVFGVLEGVLAALAHAERHGIVHRDLKPENLMITDDGRVKIADFGIAKATNRLKTMTFLTAAGTTVGTPAYMAPEQAMAQEVGPWTDLYSLGCIAFEMLVGRLPFSDTEAPMALLLRHVNEPPPPPRSLKPDLDPALSEWVERLLVKDPKERTRSAAAAWDDLEDIAIRMEGPRWRREARLIARPETGTHPLTPAPFDAATPGESEFVSYVPPGEAPEAFPPGPATPPPLGPASADMPIAVGPPTPPPLDSAAPPTEVPVAEPEPVEDTPPAPAPAPVPEVQETAPAEEPQDAAPAARAQPTDGFVTYGPTTPREPPADNEPAAAPAMPADEPSPPVEEEQPAPAPAATPVPAPSEAPPAAPQPARDEPATILPAALRESDVAATEPRRARAGATPRRGRLLVAACVVVVVAAVAGALAGGGSRPSSTGTPQSRAFTSEAAVVRAPGDWRPVTAPDVPRLGLAGATALAPPGPSGGVVVVGRTRADNPALLPAAFAREVGLDAGVPSEVSLRLGDTGAQAYRYANLRPAGSTEPMTLFVVPTTAGTVSLACLRGAKSPATWDDLCASVAGTLQVKSGRALPVGPDGRFAAVVDKALSGLGQGAKAPARSLAGARTRRAQATAARRIADAYGAARTAVAGARVRPADRGLRDALARALSANAGTWRQAAAAARSGKPASYGRARRGLPRAERALRSALGALDRAGYEVKS